MYLKTLKKDKVLKKIIKEPLLIQKQKPDLYNHLLRAIAGQQLSVKAASTIWERFILLFPDQYPHANQLISLDKEQLRSVGFSYGKAGYLKNIAEFHELHNLNSVKWKRKNEDELIEFLTQIKGVGKWTVEMILMFTLNKEDVFPLDDLGIQQAIKKLYQLDDDKKQLKTKMLAIAENWRPFRTYACIYLWRYKDNKPITNKF